MSIILEEVDVRKEKVIDDCFFSIHVVNIDLTFVEQLHFDVSKHDGLAKIALGHSVSNCVLCSFLCDLIEWVFLIMMKIHGSFTIVWFCT